MKRTLSLILLSVLVISTTYAKEYKVSSPDGKNTVTITVGPTIKWSVSRDGAEILNSSRIALILANGKVLGDNETVKKVAMSSLNGTIRPVIANKKSEIVDNCNILSISFGSGFLITFRAYNDGIAYRFETQMKDEITIHNEVSDLVFPEGSHAWFPLETSFMSHNERTSVYSALDTITDKHLASLPTLFQVNGTDILITESDIDDYPGMWLTGAGKGKISGIWSNYPDTEEQRTDRDVFITGSKDYIAYTKGTRTFPWRVFIIASSDVKLLESDLVFKLAQPCKIADTKWIKSGHVAWDWWNANNVYGVDFRAGINNDTYKY
jgi:alpha-glucosidase